MITQLRRRLFTVRYNYSDPISLQRARVLLLINWLIFAAVGLWALVTQVPGLLQRQNASPVTLVVLVAVMAANLVIHYQIQHGRLRWAIWLMVTLFTLAGMQTFITDPAASNLNSLMALALLIPLIAAGVLLNRAGTILVGLFLMVIFVLMAVFQSQHVATVTTIPARTAAADLLTTLIITILITGFLVVFAGNVERVASAALSDVKERDLVIRFGNELGALGDENEAMTKALAIISGEFRYIFAQIFLLDDEGNLKRGLRSSMNTTEVVGRVSFRVGDSNPISEAAQFRQTVITASTDPDKRRLYMLSSATFAAAVPIMSGEKVLGVMDVQTASPNGFTQAEITILELLGQQMGSALVRIRHVNDLQRFAREQEAVALRLQTQLVSYLQREQRGLTTTWSSYLEGRGQQAIGFDIEADGNATLVPASDLPPALRSTLEEGELRLETQGEEQLINVPIIFRDQTLGAMSFALPKDQDIDDRQIEMARVVADRLALALENTRLFEQSQAQALRERKANEVTGMLIGSTDVRTVLNRAAESFNEALGAIYTRIYIQPDVVSEQLIQAREEERS
jgi:GAF domain-containing protein